MLETGFMKRSRGDDDHDIFAHLRLDGDILVGSGDGNSDVERLGRAGGGVSSMAGGALASTTTASA